MDTTTYKPSKTTDFFYKINLVVHIFGLPNFWIEELKLPKKFIKFYDRMNFFNNCLICCFICFELGSFFTQNNLNQKQNSNMVLFAVSHPMLFSFSMMMAQGKEKVRAVMYNLAIGLKRVHNDPEVERQMIASTIMYFSALVFSCTLSVIMYTVDACWEVIQNHATFTTVVTAYPDVSDRSVLADVTRAVGYIVWWIFVTRVFAVYILVIPLTTCLSYQYKNLQSYFLSLNEIFESEELSQREKEEKYEARFKVGIQLHADTIRCTHQTHRVCRGVFSGQIIFNILLLVLLMTQMVNSERTFVNLCATVLTASAVLISTGFFMWNAGDVTVEASHLGPAMYFSGWYHCRGMSSARLRNLVVIAIAHAQIVKSSYSVFSVLF